MMAIDKSRDLTKIQKIDMQENDLSQKELLQRLQRDYSLFDEFTTGPEPKNTKLKLSRQKLIEQKKDEYIHSFTIHGLTRVVVGKGIECFFWAVLLIFGIAACVYIFSNLFERYNKHESYVQIYSQPTHKKYFPSITFCESLLLTHSFYSYCGMDLRTTPLNTTYCAGRTLKTHSPSTPNDHNASSLPGGLFNVTSCMGWGKKDCKKKEYLKLVPNYGDYCFTWNPNGNFHDIYGHVDIGFHFHPDKHVQKHIDRSKKKPSIIAILHDHEVTELDLTKQVRLEPGYVYDLIIDTTNITRLEAPFQSNCSKETNKFHIFDGKYSRRSCFESYNFINTYKTCGDIFDYVLQYIPKDIKEKYAQNRSHAETVKCLNKYVNEESQQEPDCPFPCEEIDLTFSSTFSSNQNHPKYNNTDFYSISVQFQTVDTTRKIEEKELYSSYQLACEIGGFIGLVIGASIMSLIELVTYFVLYIAGRWFKTKEKYDTKSDQAWLCS